MRGGYFPSTPSNLATLAVFNNSIMGELLAIWLVSLEATNSGVNAAGVYEGQIGTEAGTTNPWVTGEKAQPGLLTYSDTATVYPADLFGQYFFANYQLMGGYVPIAIIRKGWSFFIQDLGSGDNPIGMNLGWQACHMEDITGGPCPICDVIIVA